MLVEDTETHRNEGMKYLSSQGFEVVPASTQHDAMGQMFATGSRPHELQTYPGLEYQKPIVHGIITDLFFPYSNNPKSDHDAYPCGLAILIAAMRLGIPAVICTAGFHHGLRYEWIHSMLCSVMLHSVLVDMPPMSQNNFETEHGNKNWEKALKNLQGFWDAMQK